MYISSPLQRLWKGHAYPSDSADLAHSAQALRKWHSTSLDAEEERQRRIDPETAALRRLAERSHWPMDDVPDWIDADLCRRMDANCWIEARGVTMLNVAQFQADPAPSQPMPLPWSSPMRNPSAENWVTTRGAVRRDRDHLPMELRISEVGRVALSRLPSAPPERLPLPEPSEAPEAMRLAADELTARLIANPEAVAEAAEWFEALEPGAPEPGEGPTFRRMLFAWEAAAGRFFSRASDHYFDLSIEDARRVVMLAALTLNADFDGQAIGLEPLAWQEEGSGLAEGRSWACIGVSLKYGDDAIGRLFNKCVSKLQNANLLTPPKVTPSGGGAREREHSPRKPRGRASLADKVRRLLSGDTPYEGTKSELAKVVGYTHSSSLSRVKNFPNLWDANQLSLAEDRAERQRRMKPSREH